MATVSALPNTLDTFKHEFQAKMNTCIRRLTTKDVSDTVIHGCIRILESLERQLNRVKGRLLRDDQAAEMLITLNEILLEARGLLGHPKESTGFQPPKLKGPGRCAAKYVIVREQLEFLLRLGMTMPTIANTMQVSVCTVKRRLRQFGISLRKRYSNLDNDALDEMVKEAISGNKQLGEVSIKAKLQAGGVSLQRYRIRDAIHRVDPVGVAMRALRPRLQRSVYSVAAPNSLWHIDGNHKLIRWGIVIHGGIDGASRLLVFLSASNNNLSVTVLEKHVAAVATYGLPTRIRIDQGVENNDIALFMTMMRGPAERPVIRGKSCHNQRIERAWVDVWNGVTNVYYTVFAFLEYKQYLDVGSNIDIWLLQYVFMPRINHDLELFRNQWNNHGLSTEKNKTPRQLFAMGILQNANSNLTSVRNILDSNGFPTQDPEIVLPSDVEAALGRTRVDVPRLECPLSSHQLQLLHLEVDPLQHCNDHGISFYLQSKHLISTI